MNFKNIHQKLFELILTDGSTKSIQQCLEYGADPNYQRYHASYYGYTSLMVAIYKYSKANTSKYKNIIEMLLKYDALVNIKINSSENPNACDIGDVSALILAIENKDITEDIIKLLLAAGADTSLIFNGQAIDKLAFNLGRHDVVELLNSYKYEYSDRDQAIINTILNGQYTYKWHEIEELSLRNPHLTYAIEQSYRIRTSIEKLKLQGLILLEGLLTF